MRTTFPATMPVAAPFEAHHPSLPVAYPVVHRAMFEPPAPAVTDPARLGASSAVAYGDPAAAQSWTPSTAAGAWIEPTQRLDPRKREQFAGTFRMRHSDLRIVVGKVALPMVLLVIAGFFIGGYFVFSGEAIKPHDAVASTAAPRPAMPEPIVPVVLAPAPPAPPETPAPAPAREAVPAAVQAPVVAEPVAQVPTRAQPEATPAAGVELAAAANVEPAPAATHDPAGSFASQGGDEPPPSSETAARPPMMVDVRIDSAPSGATVTLIDRGKSQLVGKTPVNAMLDASREYDLLFTFPNKAAQLEHLNARTTRHVAVTLGTHASAAKPTESGPRHVEKAIVEKPPTTPVKKAVAESSPVSPARKTSKAAAPPALGTGTLMVSSKPPCEIIIDGKPTGFTTPQRAITLSAGNHKVTLVNGEKSLKKTVSVQITANTTAKVIEDLMQ